MCDLNTNLHVPVFANNSGNLYNKVSKNMSEETKDNSPVGQNKTSKAQKRKQENHTEIQNKPPTKESKNFSAKEFRKKLSSPQVDEKLSALTEFLEHIKRRSKQDCIFEYLEKGGNCLELLKTLENDSIIPPTIVFEILTHVLLNVNSKYPQYQNAAFESSQYFLKNYLTIINKMLGLSSTKKERMVILKLLTVIVTFSAVLAKEILININFYPANLEILTKNVGEKEESVRDVFIHFITAFLVDGHYPTLAVLLEKRRLVTSIISGLKYDNANTLCIVLTAMKNHILENPLVSKTAKMSVFSTPVMRDIISLYNWKGPSGVKSDKNAEENVNEYEKSKVNETVHDFLLILCTSFKFGVIFKDHSLGMGKRNQNSLMYTVVESLERPWEHSYAKQLVIKICCACPDLVKAVWVKLKEYIVPRPSVRWLKAVNFAKELIGELQPQHIEFCLNEMNINQVSYVISMLITPLPILKTVIDDSFSNDQPIKYNILLLLLEMLKALTSYLNLCKTKLTPQKYDAVKVYFQDYIIRNFPSCEAILKNWHNKSLKENTIEELSPSILQILDIIFDVFDYYLILSPFTFEQFNISEYNLENFLEKINGFESDDEVNKTLKTNLQVKTINIFYSVDPGLFSVNSEVFTFSLPLLLGFYYEFRSELSLKILRNILENTLIFQSCENEINIWLNGFLDLKRFDLNTCQFFMAILQLTHENVNDYLEKIAAFSDNSQTLDNVAEILKNLQNDSVNLHNKGVIKHTILSPLSVGCLEYLNGKPQDKYLKVYLQAIFINLFHIQTSPDFFFKIVSQYEVLPENVTNYINNWVNFTEICVLEKAKCKFKIIENFAAAFLSREDIKSFLSENLEHLSYYPDLKLNLLEVCVFYVSNLVKVGFINEQHLENFENYLLFLLENAFFETQMLSVILGNPVIFSKFSVLHLNKQDSKSILTKFIIKLLVILKNYGINFENCLNIYQGKLLNNVLSILRKPQKFSNFPNNFTETLEAIELDYVQCCEIYTEINAVLPNLTDSFCVIFEIAMYALRRIAQISKKTSQFTPLKRDQIENLCNYLNNSITNNQINLSLLAVCFKEYLEIFPHDIAHISLEFIENLINLNDFNKEVISLVVFLIERRPSLVGSIEKNLESIATKKGVFLSILEALIKIHAEDEFFEKMYLQFWPSISKALIKPQKAGQHFHKHFMGVATLLEKFLPEKDAKTYADKIQKFECSEVFHAVLLKTIFKKCLKSNDATDKQTSNMILTFVHLCVNIFKRKTKSAEDDDKLKDICAEFNDFISQLNGGFDYDLVCQNETFKLFCKFCLKFGLSGQPVLVETVASLLKILNPDEAEAKLILDMMISHSGFLDIVLSSETYSVGKVDCLSLFLVLCTKWPAFMERSHVPVLLAAYQATMTRSDKIILQLLKMYESEASRTNFYDFKPFLWGRSAASHYSVRQDLGKALWRQPKIRDVLSIIQEDLVVHTIKNYPFKNTLETTTIDDFESDKRCYDLAFLLPVFSELLAPENAVQTYVFTKCGALSLTVIGFTSEDKQIRLSCCHILQRLYNHLEAKTYGKDTLLWIRFIEAICKGLSLLDEFKLNSFAGIFLAKTALILTDPNHVMYVPLSHYLIAKVVLDFSTVPELYTFLNSNEMNCKQHQHFILELLRDGCRIDKDFTAFQKSMALKLILGLSSSCLCDSESELLVLDVILAASKIKTACRVLIDTHSVVPFLNNKIKNCCTNNNNKTSKIILEKYVQILYNFTCNLNDSLLIHCIKLCLRPLVCMENLENFSDTTLELCYKILFKSLEVDRAFFEHFFLKFLGENNDKYCEYLCKFGCDFVKESDVLCIEDKFKYYRLVYFNYLQTKKS